MDEHSEKQHPLPSEEVSFQPSPPETEETAHTLRAPEEVPANPEAPAVDARAGLLQRKKDHAERGPALLLLAIAIVLGGTAILMGISGRPASVGAFVPYVAAPTQPVPTSSVPLQRAPLGDGTVLTVAEPLVDAPLTFQEIYQKLSPSIVSVTSALPQGIAEGTGVVMTADGYIITNAHVIEGAFRVDIALEDGRSLEAKLVGRDTTTDLAVLKIEADALIPADFGNSEQMQVGDTVVAIGNPMGSQLRGTMTNGILSAINRDMTVDGNRMTLLQTTAALNSGNSGGALVNDDGQVIGITNMKLIGYDAPAEGLGFAIPTATVKPVVDALIASGFVTGRPVLGITVRAMTAQEKEDCGVAHGLWVMSVEEKSDARAKGLKVGDILLRAEGAVLDTTQDLVSQKSGRAVGDVIHLEVDRKWSRMEISVALVEQYTLSENP